MTAPTSKARGTSREPLSFAQFADSEVIKIKFAILGVALKLQPRALTRSMLHRSDWTFYLDVGPLNYEELWQYNTCLRLYCGCDGSWNRYC